MFLPENIDLAHSEKYSLSIRLVPDGFSFCIYSPTDANVFFYKETAFGNRLSYVESIKKMVFDLGFLSQVFLKTEVVLASTRFTLVPGALFDTKRTGELFRFNFLFKEGETVLHNLPRNDNPVLIFGMDGETHAFLLRSLWNPVFTHQVSRLIPAFLGCGNGKMTKRCHVDFQDAMIVVVCTDGDKLLSANVFNCNESSDALFYVASVWEKQGLDQLVDYLYLSGKVENQKSSVEVLKKLIKNVQVMDFPLKPSVSEEDLKVVPTDLKMELCG